MNRLIRSLIAHALLFIWLLGLVHLVTYALLQTVWSRVDEAQHFHYVQYLAESRSLPVNGQTFVSRKVVELSLAMDQWGWNPPHTVPPPLDLDPRDWRTVPSELEGEERFNWIGDNLWYFSYEAMQPPLYYSLGAIVYGLLPDSTYWQLYVLRLMSAVIASFTIPLAYLTIRETAPDRKELALAVSATIALLPGFVLNLSQVTNDSLATTMSSLCIFLLVRGMRRGIGFRGCLLVGSVIGLSLLTKVTTVYLIPLAIIALGASFFRGYLSFLAMGMPTVLRSGLIVGRLLRLMSFYKSVRICLRRGGAPVPAPVSATEGRPLRHQPNPKHLAVVHKPRPPGLALRRSSFLAGPPTLTLSQAAKGLSLIVLPSIIVAPWLLHNWLTYGDLTGSPVASGLMGAIFRPVQIDSPDAIGAYLGESWSRLTHSFWFGEPFSPWRYWESVYNVLWTLTLLAPLGLILYFRRLGGGRQDRNPKIWLVMATGVVLHLTEILIMPMFGGLGVVGRYLYPSLIPVVGLLWLGTLSLARAEAHRFILVIAIGGLAVLDLLNFIFYVTRTYG